MYGRAAARGEERLMKEFRIETEQDALSVTQFLEDRIYEHNSSRINKNDGRLFSRVVRGEDGSIVAGIAGWTWAGACEITQFWVSENARNKGIGRMLLHAAEEEAKGRKCSIVLVKTYSFQAPWFYEKCGYRIEHVIEDFPVGHRYYTFTKTI
jgi:GNAT superfamily N-acetyltransferase